MVARIAASFVALTAATIVGATAVPRGGGGKCNTGPIQCCQQLQKEDPLNILSTFLGINCTPITVIGAGAGASCTQAPVCCQNNSVGGLINVGCVPVEL